MEKRPAKHPKIVETIRAAGKARMVRFSKHAEERCSERDISYPEVFHILASGFHEIRKDEFKPVEGNWSYAIRGKTPDKRNLRIGVAIEASGAVVVTAIDLDREK